MTEIDKLRGIIEALAGRVKALEGRVKALEYARRLPVKIETSGIPPRREVTLPIPPPLPGGEPGPNVVPRYEEAPK